MSLKRIINSCSPLLCPSFGEKFHPKPVKQNSFFCGIEKNDFGRVKNNLYIPHVLAVFPQVQQWLTSQLACTKKTFSRTTNHAKPDTLLSKIQHPQMHVALAPSHLQGPSLNQYNSYYFKF